MNEEALRAVLRDIAEEAVPVDFTDKAMSRGNRRRAILIGTGAAAVVALALGVTPLALAGINPSHGPVAPAGPGTASTGPGPSSSTRPAPGQSQYGGDPGSSYPPAPGQSQYAGDPGSSYPPAPRQSQYGGGPGSSYPPAPGQSQKAP